MDYLLTKLFHLVGIMLLFLGLGVMLIVSTLEPGDARKRIIRLSALLHGFGLVFILISGIAMLNSLGFLHGDPPGWVKAKFGIFLILAFALTFAKRLRLPVWVLLGSWGLLGVAAAYLALYKPF